MKTLLNLLFLVFVASSIASAQNCVPELLPDSLHVAITEGRVNAVARAGNNLYFGGDFKYIANITGSLAEVDAAGVSSSTNNLPFVQGTIKKIIQDGTGGWIIAGRFTSVGDSVRTGIACIDINGQITSLNPVIPGMVNDISIFGSTLILAGSFTSVNNTPRNNLAAIDLITGQLTAFNPDANNSIRQILVNGNNLYLLGIFTQLGGQSRKGLAAVDLPSGTVTAWNPVSSSSQYAVWRSMAINNNDLFLGGIFYSINNIHRPGLVAFDLTNGAMTGFNAGLKDTNGVMAITVSGNTMYIGGCFDSVQSQHHKNFATIDLQTYSVKPWTVANIDYISEDYCINNLSILNDKVHVNLTFTVDVIFPLLDPIITTVSYAFDTLNGQALSWTAGENDSIFTMVYYNSHVVLGGSFTGINKIGQKNLAAINMNTGNILPWYPEVNEPVVDIKSDGLKIFVAGLFDSVNHNYRRKLAAFDSYTGNLTSWAPHSNNRVYTLEIHNGLIYAGGIFSFIGGESRHSLAALDPVTGHATSWDVNMNGSVQAIAIQGNIIYVGGFFNMIDTIYRRCLASIDIPTGIATSWIPNFSIDLPDIKTLLINGNNIYVGGNFTSIDGVPRNNAACFNRFTGVIKTWNPTFQSLFSTTGPYYTNFMVNSLLTDGEKVFAAGQFKQVENGTPRRVLAFTNMVDAPTYNWDPQILNDAQSAYITGDRLILCNPVKAGNHKLPGMVQYHIDTTVPHITIVPDKVKVCYGEKVKFVAYSVLTGYKNWYVNGEIVASGIDTLWVIPQDGDQINCELDIQNVGCFSSNTIVSNTVTMVVSPPLIPGLTISGPQSVQPGAAVQLTATIADPTLTNYIIEWYNNGVPLGISTTPNFTYTNTGGNDSITAIIIPQVGCYKKDTAYSIIFDATSVSTVSTTHISVYPNPFRDQVRIDGLGSGDIVTVYDLAGRKMSGQFSAEGNRAGLLLPLSELATGTYIIRIHPGSSSGDFNILIRKQ